MQAQELYGLFAAELVQLKEEGVEVASLEQRFKQVSNPPTAADVAELEDLFRSAAAAEVSGAFPYQEPSDLEAIKAQRPEGVHKFAKLPNRKRLEDKVLGAWLGRAAGCMLGKPVEGRSKEAIQAYLEHCDSYPLDDYFPWCEPESMPEGVGLNFNMKSCLRPHIEFAERDDDTDYTLFNQVIFKHHGPEFTTQQVGEGWLTYFPYYQVYTAERVAYRNLVEGCTPPATARVRNPFREWIGAQIRADFWGYVVPGQPELAAEFAWRDAALSHVKNGIYGEQFFAALIASCFATDDLDEALDAALAEIPARCRLAEVIANTRKWCAEDGDWTETWEKIMAAYGKYHPVHTLNNAALVVMGLLHSKGDFGQAIAIAVMGGLDTDCNGATAGSVMGALLGAEALPEKWTAPLRDTLHSAVQGYNVNKLSELAKETLALQVL